MFYRWLAGNSHLLGAHNWSIQSIVRIIDKLHDAFLQVKTNQSLNLHEMFIESLLSETSPEITELSKQLELMFEKKQTTWTCQGMKYSINKLADLFRRIILKRGK